jgi:aspartate aminotransferase-like enzyme
MTRTALVAMGLKLFAPHAPSAAATAVLAPEGVDSAIFVKQLKARFGAIITNGQGEMQGKLFRIAHLGFFDYMDTIALVGALEQVIVHSLPELGVKFGAGLTAAQEQFAISTHPQAEKRTCICGRTDACCSMLHPAVK